MTGICKYCGQIVNVADKDIATEEQAQEYASMYCNCRDAVRWQEKAKADRKAAEEREQALKRAQEQIDDLFGAGSVGYGLIPLLEENRSLMYEAAVLVYDGNIKDITVNINSCVKVKLSKSAKGKIIFMRSDAAVYKQEA
jgi:hypothetical protein